MHQLAQAYHNIFREFLSTPLKQLRLLPISGGIYAGSLQEHIHEITAQAIVQGFNCLSYNCREQTKNRQVQMCIFEKTQHSKFSKAFRSQHEQAKEAKSQAPRTQPAHELPSHEELFGTQDHDQMSHATSGR